MPKHIHVKKGENFAKIELTNLTVIENYFSKSENEKCNLNNKRKSKLFSGEMG